MKKYLLVNLGILILILAVSLLAGLFMLGLFKNSEAAAAANDKIPPKIFNSKVFDVTATSATVTWQTDEESDSLVNFGLNRNYGMVRDPFYDKLEHRIVLDDLLPDTSYYFRLISTDKDGNQAISSDFTFVTPAIEKEEITDEVGQYPGPSEEEGTSAGPSEEPGKYPGQYDKEGQFEFPLQEEISQETMKEILETVNKIKTEKVLEIIQQQIQQQAESVEDKLEIIFDQVDVEVGTDYAIIKWKTNKEANSIVSMVAESGFDANAADPYLWSEGKFDERVVDHQVHVTGLSPATTYHFRVSSETILGLKSQSTDHVFTTKSILPEIYNISIAKIEEDAATITFLTNVPCSSLIEYTNLDNNDTRMEGSTAYTTIHSVRLTNLKYDTYYSAMITAENEQNEKVQSEPITFLTIKDEVPPIVSKIKTESTLYPGADNKVQTIVAWETDEQAVCQFFFHQGLVAPDKVEELPIENDYTQKHTQVTTNLLPSTVYKFWIECFDDVNNKSRSSDFIMLTPTREENIIDIIMKNFESTFGWVKSFNKK